MRLGLRTSFAGCKGGVERGTHPLHKIRKGMRNPAASFGERQASRKSQQRKSARWQTYHRGNKNGKLADFCYGDPHRIAEAPRAVGALTRAELSSGLKAPAYKALVSRRFEPFQQTPMAGGRPALRRARTKAKRDNSLRAGTLRTQTDWFQYRFSCEIKKVTASQDDGKNQRQRKMQIPRLRSG